MPEDFNDEGFESIPNNWFAYNKIGDFIRGTLVSIQTKNVQTPEGATKTQQIYEIMADAGAWHLAHDDENGSRVVDKKESEAEPGQFYNIGSKESIDQQMRHIKLGQKVLFRFTEVIPSKDKTRKAFKKVTVKAGQMDEAFNSELSMKD